MNLATTCILCFCTSIESVGKLTLTLEGETYEVGICSDCQPDFANPQTREAQHQAVYLPLKNLRTLLDSESTPIRTADFPLYKPSLFSRIKNFLFG